MLILKFENECIKDSLYLFLHQVTLHASSKLHDKNFLKILRCPMKFFDSTPIGRIVNRFSYDMDESE